MCKETVEKYPKIVTIISGGLDGHKLYGLDENGNLYQFHNRGMSRDSYIEDYAWKLLIPNHKMRDSKETVGL